MDCIALASLHVVTHIPASEASWMGCVALARFHALTHIPASEASWMGCIALASFHVLTHIPADCDSFLPVGPKLACHSGSPLLARRARPSGAQGGASLLVVGRDAHVVKEYLRAGV